MGNSVKGNSGQPITSRGRIFLVIWALAIVLFYSFAGFQLSSQVYQYKMDALAQHQSGLDADRTGPSSPSLEESSPEGDGPVDVQTGVFVDRIADLSIKDSRWVADFYIWFKWAGDRVNPGANLQVVDGDIQSISRQWEWTDGQELYEVYQVVASITKSFNITRFPCDDHLLTIRIEDQVNDSIELRYVPDARNSGISSGIRVPGFEIRQASSEVRLDGYQTNFGIPKQDSESTTPYSQFTYNIWIVRPGWGLFLKIFQGLFIAVAVSLLAFFILPIRDSPRFGLGLGALFAAVANSYIVISSQPTTGIVTMADMVSGIGIITVFLTLVQSTISLYIYDQRGERSLSRLFDLTSLGIILVGYTALNWCVLQAASI